MKILGICHDVLICSACVVVDGKVVSAMPEERLDRVKQSRVFPKLAIDACLQEAGLRMDDIDEVAVGWNPALELGGMPAGYLDGRRWRSEHFVQVPGRLLGGRDPSAEISLNNLWPDSPPITYVNHYNAHIGNALYLSPYEESAILVLDGRGERQTSLLATAKGTHVEILDDVRFPHSLGLLYGTVTQFLGFRPDADEWKVMALGSYQDGDNEFYEPMSRLIEVEDSGKFHLALEYFEFYNFWEARMYSERFTNLFGTPRKRDDELTVRHHQIAAAMQRVFEKTITKILHRLHERCGLDQLVVSGGCFMNSVYNGKIETETPFKNVFITSCPDDSGTSLGAALYLHGQRTGERPLDAMKHNYWGQGFTDEQCLDAVNKFKLPNAVVVDDPSASAAQDLVDGKIVGWFQGRVEFGQRALGNRSILIDPRREDAKDLINAAVKYRESFRPFAPAILVEKVAEYFECGPEFRSAFMERVIPFRKEKRAEVPAVVHVDGSGRLQTVDEYSSPRYRALIEAFYEKTQTPIVLNTSFNLNGEPIVNTPEDAVRTFFTCGLDVMYLGNVRIEK